MMLAIPMVLEMIMESVFAVVDVFFRGPFGRERCGYCWLDGVLVDSDLHSRGGIEHRRFRHGVAGSPAGTIKGGTGRGTDSSPGSFHIGGFERGRKHLRAGTAGLDGASPEVVAYGSGYTRVLLGGNIVIIMLFLVNAIFRGAGDGAIQCELFGWLTGSISCFVHALSWD